MQGKTVYIRPKVVGPFPGPCADGSYVHRSALSGMKSFPVEDYNLLFSIVKDISNVD
jgi:hypothetical protein